MWRLVFILGLGLLGGTAATAADLEGSVDHALLKRYEGTEIIGYQVKEYDEFRLLLGKVTQESGTLKLVAEKQESLEGKVTRILYRGAGGRSSLEVYRNYEKELETHGFEILYECAQDECGYPPRVYNYVYKGELDTAVHDASMAFGLSKNLRLMTAKLRRQEEGDVYASVMIAENDEMVVVFLELLELEPMEERMVVVKASEMAERLTQDGRVALYGFYFDTDSDVMKPESEPTVAEIVTLLTSQPSLNLYVVGHTDNQGTPEYNMGLSQRRARSITRVLTEKHGVAAARLRSEGVGLFAPVATNATEEGRALNRRVELVPQ